MQKRSCVPVFLITFCLVAKIATISAQTNFSFYPVEKYANAMSFNPAFLTQQSKLNFGILPISGVNIGYNNLQVIKNIGSNVLSGDQAMKEYHDVFNTMLKLNLFIQKAELNILTFGYNSKIGSFDFRIKENLQSISDVSSEFTGFITDNTSQILHVGDVESFPAFEVHFREYSVGYAKEIIRNKLTFGARAKVYFGKSAISSEVVGTSSIRNQDLYLQMYGNMKVSLPIYIELDRYNLLRKAGLSDDFSVGRYLTNSANRGIGLDFGFNYNVTPELELSASLIDLGYINWESNLNSMKFDGEYLFPKQYIMSSENGIVTRDTDFSFETVDIRQLYKIKPDNTSFRTVLPANIYSALKYRLTSSVSVGIVNRFVSKKSMGFNSLSGVVLWQINQRLTINSGYAMIGKDLVNIPFNLLYEGNFGQFFFGSDNILSLLGSAGSGFMGATFGMNINLLRNKEKYGKQIEYLPFYRNKK